jgi:hypothetical protein
MCAKAVAQHADEPQEGNSGERHQIQVERNPARADVKP